MSPGTVLEPGIVVVTDHESQSWWRDSLTVTWFLLGVGVIRGSLKPRTPLSPQLWKQRLQCTWQEEPC